LGPLQPKTRHNSVGYRAAMRPARGKQKAVVSSRSQLFFFACHRDQMSSRLFDLPFHTDPERQ